MKCGQTFHLKKDFVRKSLVYDRLGLVSPALVSVKKLLQDLCRKKLGWDDEIASEETMRYFETFMELFSPLPQCVKSDYSI